MPIVYDAALKSARLTAVRERIVGGTLEVGTEGFAEILARFRITAAEVVESELVCGGMPKRASATNKGRGAVARFVDAAGIVCVDGLTVGDEKSDAEVTIYPDADIKSGQTVELMGVRIIHG